ncbi:MAG: DUF4339 domain-containing protein [Akkermansia sp.]|nr:DUF4339 domain-containing protein [Akkermansia sp.]
MARKFYYDTGTEKVGPVTGADLVRLRASGEINNETWVRRADNNTWRPLHTVNLNEEEEEVRNPGLFTILKQSGLLGPLLVVLLGLALFIVVAIGAIQIFWPVLLLLFIFWLLSKALK